MNADPPFCTDPATGERYMDPMAAIATFSDREGLEGEDIGRVIEMWHQEEAGAAATGDLFGAAVGGAEGVTA